MNRLIAQTPFPINTVPLLISVLLCAATDIKADTQAKAAKIRLPWAPKQNPVDAQVDRVQEHFRFTLPDGRGIDHDNLKKLLLKPSGDNQFWDGHQYVDITYLSQALQLSSLMDAKKRFEEKQYFEVTSKLDSDLIASALGYPTLPKPTFEDAFKIAGSALENKYPKSRSVFTTYDHFQQLYAIYQLIEAIVDRYKVAAVNHVVTVYMASVKNPDKDDVEWSDISDSTTPTADVLQQQIRNPIFGRKHPQFDIHEFCRTQWRMRDQLEKSLDQDIASFKNAFALVLKENQIPNSIISAPILVIDRSGSITDAPGVMGQIQNKAEEVVRAIQQSVKTAAVINFSGEGNSSVDTGFTSDQNALLRAIRNPSVNNNGTAVYDAVEHAVEVAHGRGDKTMMILFTDGKNNQGHSLDEAIRKCMENSVPVVIVGFSGTEGRNDDDLRQLAIKTGGFYEKSENVTIKDILGRFQLYNQAKTLSRIRGAAD